MKNLILFRLLGLCLMSLVSFTSNSLAAPVNINSADVKSIADALAGIGIKKAEAIVKYRQEHGPFKTVEQLMDVPGIGEKTVEKNRNDILLDATPPAPAAAPAAPVPAAPAQPASRKKPH